jgi:hypothetical protein
LYRDGGCAVPPIYVSLDVWNEVEDMTEALRKMQQESSPSEESDKEEES